MDISPSAAISFLDIIARHPKAEDGDRAGAQEMAQEIYRTERIAPWMYKSIRFLSRRYDTSIPRPLDVNYKR